MKKLFYYVAMFLATTTGFSSCSDDDDDERNAETELRKQQEMKDLTSTYVNDVVYVTYGRLADATESLYGKIETMKSSLSAGSLTALRRIAQARDRRSVFQGRRRSVGLCRAWDRRKTKLREG